MTAIALLQINPLALPSLPLEWRKALPECRAIYFVISQQNEVLYIGSSINLSKRWLQHHKQQELEKIGNVRLAWLEIIDEALLREAENELISKFKPVFNSQRTLNRKKVKKGKTKNTNRKCRLRWKLKEIMARHRVKGKDLANYLGISTNAMSSLRNAFVMPKIGGEKWGKISTGINKLSKISETVTPLDLIEYIPEESIPPAIGTNKTQKTATNSSRTKDSTSYEAKSHLVAHLKGRKNVA